MNNRLWKDWTEEDWSNAVFCDNCGLPMFAVPFEEQQHGSDQEIKVEGGTYQCAYCTWKEDEQYIPEDAALTDLQIARQDQIGNIIFEDLHYFLGDSDELDAACTRLGGKILCHLLKSLPAGEFISLKKAVK